MMTLKAELGMKPSTLCTLYPVLEGRGEGRLYILND